MRVCDRCRSEQVADYKLNLVRPEAGSGDRSRNSVVESAALELCAGCVPAFWRNVRAAVAANLSGRDVGVVDKPDS
jgi:hypothetical protein